MSLCLLECWVPLHTVSGIFALCMSAMVMNNDTQVVHMKRNAFVIVLRGRVGFCLQHVFRVCVAR